MLTRWKDEIRKFKGKTGLSSRTTGTARVHRRSLLFLSVNTSGMMMIMVMTIMMMIMMVTTTTIHYCVTYQVPAVCLGFCRNSELM